MQIRHREREREKVIEGGKETNRGRSKLWEGVCVSERERRRAGRSSTSF